MSKMTAAAYDAALARQVARQIEAAEYEIARVELGSKCLDKCNPGWEWRIDLGTLGHQQPNRCILEQTFGSFIEGSSQVRRGAHADHTLTALGFVGRDRAEDVSLTAAWTRFILARRAAQTA